MKGMKLPKMSTVKPFYPKHRTASDKQCPNILKQRFDPSEPNKVWVCGFTYLRAAGRFYYLCIILDLFSRKVIAYKLSPMKFVTGLNCTADLDFAYDEFSRVFEKYAKEHFCKKSVTSGKEKIRLHHYIQSFKPDEVSPEQSHKIGVECAEKVFGKNHQILVTTHVDRQHIHNHFAVAAFELDGKKWYGNKTSLKRCREISDKICKSYGLSIIENPTYKNNQKYADWLARQINVSWKTRLCDDIDKIVLREDVKSVEDLAELSYDI